MSTIAFDQFALTRIADFARSLSRLHQASRRQPIDDDAIDREFNAVCLSVWGYTTDDFSDDLFSDTDHAWLDSLDEAHARIFAAEQGYDLVDDNGMLTDWWGLLLDDPRREARPADAGKPRGGARCHRGKIPDGTERDWCHRRALRFSGLHPEETRILRGVSKDGRTLRCSHPSRRGQGAAPQDEDGILFAPLESSEKPAKHSPLPSRVLT